MIFSFTEGIPLKVNLQLPHVDIFCYFPAAHSTLVPVYLWKDAVAASLRMKKEVLILEENLAEIPLNSNARWLVGDQFLWLPHRSLSVFLEATHDISITYPLLKSSLLSRK